MLQYRKQPKASSSWLEAVKPVLSSTLYTVHLLRTEIVSCNAGHGLQWLWPFLLGYAPRKTAILDEVCIVHPHDHLQYLLKLDLNARLQQYHQSQQQPLSNFSLLFSLSNWFWSAATKQLPVTDFSVEELTAAPGREFEHTGAPGKKEALQEAEQLLKRYRYKAELFGMKDRSAESVKAVFQPWYQNLLDMGNIQVCS